MRNENLNHEEFDPTLARALKPVDAPMSLEARLMAAAEKESSRGKVLAFPKAPVWLSGAIAAVLVMGVVVGERVHTERQQEQIAQTQRQFDDAMRVTNRALDQTREKLAKAGLGLSE